MADNHVHENLEKPYDTSERRRLRVQPSPVDPRDHVKPTYPFVSVIIPTHDRPDPLHKCLQGFERQTYPSDRFEVIVVDDGGKASLDATIAPFKDRIAIRLFKQFSAGPAKGRNLGASHAKGELLAFIDDDCYPASDWLENLANRILRSWDALIGGPVINILTGNPFSSASQLINDFLCGQYNETPDDARFLTSNNMAVAHARFQAIGGFNASFPYAGGEDREFCERWLSHGQGIVFAPEMQVYHEHHLTFLSFLRQQFNYGKGGYLFHVSTANRRHNSIQLNPMSFYVKLLCYPFAKVHMPTSMLLALLLCFAQMAVAVGFLSEWVDSKIGNHAS